MGGCYNLPLRIRQPGSIRVKCNGFFNASDSAECPPCDCAVFNNWGAPKTLVASFGNSFSLAAGDDGGACGFGCGVLNDFIQNFTGSPGSNFGEGPFTLSLVSGPCIDPATSDGAWVPETPLAMGWDVDGDNTYLLAPGGGTDPRPNFFLIDPPAWTLQGRFCSWQSAAIPLNDICGSGSAYSTGECRIGFCLGYDPGNPDWGICASLSVGAYGPAADGCSQTTWYNWFWCNLGQDAAWPPPDPHALPSIATVLGQVGCANEIQANGKFELGDMLGDQYTAGRHRRHFFFEWQNWWDPNCGDKQPIGAVPQWPECNCSGAPADIIDPHNDLGCESNRQAQFLCVKCLNPGDTHWQASQAGSMSSSVGADCTGASKTAPPCCCGGPTSDHDPRRCFYVCLKPSDPNNCDLAGEIALCPVKGEPNTYQGCTVSATGANICATLTYSPDGPSWTTSITYNGEDCLSPPPFTPGQGWQNVGGGIQLGGTNLTPSGSCCASGTVDITITNTPEACWGGASLPCCQGEGNTAGTIPAEITVTLPGLGTTPNDVQMCGGVGCPKPGDVSPTYSQPNPCDCDSYAGDYVLTLSGFAGGEATYELTFPSSCQPWTCCNDENTIGCVYEDDAITAKISCNGAVVNLTIGRYSCLDWVSAPSVGAQFPCCATGGKISLPWGLAGAMAGWCQSWVTVPCFLPGAFGLAGDHCWPGGETPGAVAAATITWGDCPPT